MIRRAAVLAAWLSAAVGCSGGGSAPKPPDVVLVVFDTLRADHLGCYGYSRDTSPNLDRFAEEGARFTQAWSQAPWTLPAFATLLTGRLPHEHGAGRDAQGRLRALRPGVPTLAERLAARGYRTAAFVNVGFCAPPSGLARGFERYDFRLTGPDNRGHRRADETVDAALEWLDRQAPQTPLFLVVHLFDPHLTYDPPPPYDTRFEPDGDPAGRIPPGFGSAREVLELRSGTRVLTPRQRRSLVARYDGEIAFADAAFGALRRGLEAAGRWEGSLVVVTADHGEEFWDHGGFEHGHTHYDELLHVPMLVRWPGGRGPRGELAERVRLLDVAPSVLEAVGIEHDLPGRVLGSGGAETSVAEGSLWAGDLVSVRSDAGTLILDRTRGTVEREGFEDPETRRRMLETLEALPRLDGAPWEPSPEVQDQLRSLGYLGAAPARQSR